MIVYSLPDRHALAADVHSPSQVQRSGFVLGAFTPARWPADPSAKGHVSDPSGGAFLFSLVNAHGWAIKVRLKLGEHKSAIGCYGAVH